MYLNAMKTQYPNPAALKRFTVPGRKPLQEIHIEHFYTLYVDRGMGLVQNVEEIYYNLLSLL